MDSNTHSGEPAAGLAALASAVDQLAAQDLTGLPDAVRAERVLGLRRLLDRLEGHWLAELAAVDARGAAGADQGVAVGSTARWLRGPLRPVVPPPPGAGPRPPRPPPPPRPRRRAGAGGGGPPAGPSPGCGGWSAICGCW